MSSLTIRRMRFLASALALSAMCSAGHAATWINASGGSWGTAGNWSGGIIAGGVDDTADFSTLNIVANATVTLDGPRTVGHLLFADATTASHDWILNTGSGGPLTLDVSAGVPTITVNNRTATINAVIAGNEGFTKTGGGLLVLSGNNSYTGLTTVFSNSVDNNGITITTANALGASGPGNGTLVQNVSGNTGGSGTTLRLQNNITVAEAITLNPTNVDGDFRVALVNNSGTNTLTGPIDLLGSGLAQFTVSGGTLNITGDISDSGFAGTLLLRGNGTGNITGSINIGTSTLSRTDDGVFTIGAAGETYSWGNTQVSRGTLRTNLANMLPSATVVTIGQGSDTSAATLDLNGFSQSISGITYNANGVGTISTGAGTLTLLGNVTSSTTNNTSNVLSGLVNLGGGTRTFTINEGAAAVDLNVTASVSNGNITKAGAGTLRLSGNNTFGAGTFTYGANDTLNLGAIRMASANAMGNYTTINLSGNNAAQRRIELEGGINFNAYNILTNGRSSAQGVGAALVNISGNNTWNDNLSINGTGGGYGIRSDAGTLTINGNLLRPLSSADTRNWEIGGAGNIIYNGVANETGAQGVMGFTKFGTGTVTFTGANLHDGNTTVTGGTLLINNVSGSGLGNGNAIVNAGATLGGTGAFTGSATVNTNATLAPGGVGILESLGTGNLTFGNNAIYHWDFLGATADVTNVLGTLVFGTDLTIIANSLDAGEFIPNIDYVLFTYTGVDPTLPNINFQYSGEARMAFRVDAENNRVLASVIVPEPATMSLLVLGGLGLLRRRR